MQFNLRLLVLLSVVFAFTGCAAEKKQETAAAPAADAGSAKRKAAPDFELKDSEGRTVKLSDYKGKVVLLNFWATWCGPCKIEIPWFVEFEQKYKDQGFAVLGVSMDEEGWEVVKPYLEKNRINYRVVIGDEKLSEAYGGVESLPTTFVLDRDGRIVSEHVGLVSKSDYEDEIRKTLDQRAGASSPAFAFLARADQP